MSMMSKYFRLYNFVLAPPNLSSSFKLTNRAPYPYEACKLLLNGDDWKTVRIIILRHILVAMDVPQRYQIAVTRAQSAWKWSISLEWEEPRPETWGGVTFRRHQDMFPSVTIFRLHAESVDEIQVLTHTNKIHRSCYTKYIINSKWSLTG
jgi:hypothetical protein